MPDDLKPLREFFDDFSKKISPELAEQIQYILNRCREKLERLQMNPEEIQLDRFEQWEFEDILKEHCEAWLSTHKKERGPYQIDAEQEFSWQKAVLEKIALDIADRIKKERDGIKGVLRKIRQSDWRWVLFFLE